MSYNIGIDYSGGLSNYDKENGIHFGVIPIHDLHEWVWDSFEADYGPPNCPECGNEVVDYDEEEHGEYKPSRERGCCADHACSHCEIYLDSDQVYGDEPIGWELDDGEYVAFVDGYNDVWLVKSPYWTHCQYCSPCAPGAGHLRNSLPADSGAPKVYCFGPDWFDDDKVPYDVYSVKTGELVQKAFEEEEVKS